MDASPRDPADGGVVTYTVSYCDTTGYPADVSSAFFGVTSSKFVPQSGTWTSCPTGNCGVDAQGNLTIGAFTVPANECVTFTFTLQLQTGQGGEQVCEQGSSTLKSQSPPNIGFPCQKRTDDPLTGTVGDATCVMVQDPAPGCTVTAVAEPPLLATCAGSGDSITAENSTQNGCPGGTLTYQWRRNGVDIPGATDAVYAIPLDEPAGGAQYRCLVGCEQLPACQDLSNQVQVTVFEPSSQLVAPPSSCTGETVDVIVQGGVACIIDCGNGQAPVSACATQCTYPTSGSYTITATADDGNCVSMLESPIDVIDQPVACVDLPAGVCEAPPTGPTMVVLRNCSAAGLTYDWSADRGTLDDPAAREPVLTLGDVTAVTPVTVTLTVTSPQGCGAPDQTMKAFDLLPSPDATASADPLQACVGEVVQFTGDASGSPGPYGWLWDFGDGTGSTDKDPAKAYDAAGAYDAVLTVTDQGDGCATLSAPVRVTVMECVQDCLYRTLVADRDTLDPSAVYLVPRTPEDIGLQGAPFQCPVAAGDRDTGAIGDGNELGIYQVTGFKTLRLARTGPELRDLEFTF